MKTEETERRPRRPFKGKPQAINLASTFLPTADSDGHFDDWSPISAAKRYDEELDDPGTSGSLETLIRGVMRTANRPGQTLKPQQVEGLRALFESIGVTPEVERLLSALGGDIAAAKTFWAGGEWVAMHSIMLPITAHWARPKLDLYSEIQAGCRPVDELMVAGRYADAAAAIEANVMAQPYFTPAGLAHLSTSRSPRHALVSQSFALCELQMSALARVATQSTFGPGDDIAQLVDHPPGKDVVPGRQFVRWIMREVGATTLMGFIDVVAARSPRDAPRLREASLKRWSAGIEFPSNQALQVLGDTLFKGGPTSRNAQSPDFQVPEVFSRGQPLLWAARRLHKTMTLLALVASQLEAQGLAEYVPSLLGAPTISEWASTRFEFWRTHWD